MSQSDREVLDGLVDDWVRDVDPKLIEAMVASSLAQFDDATIYLIATYALSNRKTYISCALKSVKARSIERERQSHIDQSSPIQLERNLILFHNRMPMLYQRLCVLVDDLRKEKLKQVYLRITHSKGRGRQKAWIVLARPRVCPPSLVLQAINFLGFFRVCHSV